MMPVIRAERRGSCTSPTSFCPVRLVGIKSDKGRGGGLAKRRRQKNSGTKTGDAPTQESEHS
jgi:hypothetical protein